VPARKVVKSYFAGSGFRQSKFQGTGRAERLMASKRKWGNRAVLVLLKFSYVHWGTVNSVKKLKVRTFSTILVSLTGTASYKRRNRARCAPLDFCIRNPNSSISKSVQIRSIKKTVSTISTPNSGYF